MIERIKTAPLSVKIAIGILCVLFLILVYVAPVAVILLTAGAWSLHKVISHFVDEELK